MSDARADLMRLVGGFRASRAVQVAATLGLADRLRDGPATAAELAPRVNAHPDALHRLMRVLTAVGVLRADAGDRFALTAMGEFLRGDVVGSCASMAELFGRESVWRAWGDLLHTVQTGTTAFDHVHGCDVWEHRARHPEEAAVFDRAMASGTGRFAQAALEACDFGRFRHVVDVGGGDGAFLAAILDRHPTVRGTLFDLPHVIERRPHGERLRAVAGDFFERVPDGADAYLLKWILHDWSDPAAVAILRTCRRAMRADGRVLVVEHVLGMGPASPEGELMDLTMMVMNGGRERSAEQFEALFAAAGLRLVAVTPTATPLCLIEGVIAVDLHDTRCPVLA